MRARGENGAPAPDAPPGAGDGWGCARRPGDEAPESQLGGRGWRDPAPALYITIRGQPVAIENNSRLVRVTLGDRVDLMEWFAHEIHADLTSRLEQAHC